MKEKAGPYFEDFHPDELLIHPERIKVTRELFTQLVKLMGFQDQEIHVNPEYAIAQGYRDIILLGPIVYTLVFQLTRQQIS